MSQALSRMQAVLLGAVVLAGLGLAGLGVFAVGSRQWLWSDTFTVGVGFPSVQGVEPGTRVRIQGIDAGQVEHLEPPRAPGGEVVLWLRLDGRHRHLVRADAMVQIVNEGMLGGKVVEIHPGTPAAPPVEERALLSSRPTTELADVLGQVNRLLEAVDAEKGRVGELVQNSNNLLRQGQETMTSIQQVAEGVKRVPVLRNYVEDPQELLYRPNCERSRQCFAAGDLFEPGRAVLTAGGQQRLDGLIPWLWGLTRHEGAEVVVAAYADPAGADPALARTLTRQQCETVCDYLKAQGAVYKKYWMISRKVTALGCGVQPPPAPEKEPLPPARVEIIVFVPQGP